MTGSYLKAFGYAPGGGPFLVTGSGKLTQAAHRI